jgi:hypothetical protein
MISIVVVAWIAGLVVAVGVPSGILLYRATRWRTLPRSKAKVKGKPPSAWSTLDLALLEFEASWGTKGILKGVRFEWVEGDHWVGPDGKKRRGRTFSKDSIKVTARDKGLGHTALFHECAHVALWRDGYAFGDPDHEKPNYPGWTEKTTKLVRELKLDFALPTDAMPTEEVGACASCDRPA